MTFTVTPLGLAGLLEIRPHRISDERGFFSETWSSERFREAGLSLAFVQDNHSLSVAKGTLRGLHYQAPPREHDKLVRVARGAIFDVAVDIRPGSATFAKWFGIEVSAREWNQIFIPRGFAHGFLTLEPDTEVIYKTTDHYSPAHDRSIRFDDPDIGISWPKMATRFVLSEKDRRAPGLAQMKMLEPS